MLKYKFGFMKHGFTVIELIVIMAVMAILVFLGSLGYKGYTKQARFTRLQYDARVLSDACQRFYVDNGDYPRLTDTPYTADQVNAFSTKVYDQKGAVIALDSSGSYYDLDFSKLKKYVLVKEDYKNFILQNPVGDIYFLEPKSNIRLPENASLKLAAPTLTVDATKNPVVYNVIYPPGVTPQETDYQLDGGTIVTSAPLDLLTAGSHNIKVRYKFNNNYSDWVSTDFIIINGVKDIVAGANHTVALMNDGSVKSWGSNQFGQLGISTNSGTNNPNPIPTTVPGLTGVKQLAAGTDYTLALMQDGSVKAWGINSYGQLGVSINSGKGNPNPTPIIIPGLTGVSQITSGGSHSLAIMQDGSVKAWGNNYYGQLGNTTNNGTNNPNPTLTTISGLKGVKQVVAGWDYTLALMQDNTVKALGYNNYGQLGTTTNNGTDNPNPVPATVPGLTNVKQIEAASYHAIALMQDGTVKAWGFNYYGQLGTIINNLVFSPNPTPTTIPGLIGVKQISAGTYYSLALLQDGTVKAWGYNAYGQLGISTNIRTNNPNPTLTAIPNLTDAKQVVTGGNHALAIMQDGSVKAWGYNGYGQLGNSTATQNSTPTAIDGLQ